jgi:peptidoglycan/xylan/chitin deacetylase (PgdA/CDA1 family)
MATGLNEQWYRTTDIPGVAGPPRELVGYGEHPPKISWPGGAKVAIQIILNYEEGSEKTYAMGDDFNEDLYELPYKQEGMRDLAIESAYEYGSRAGVWRQFRVFANAGINVTCVAAAVALERNIAVAKKLAERGDEVAGHGYRWVNHFEMTRDEEREAIKRAVASIKETVGERPLGWYCREMSVNTRELVVEEGGFVYDFDCYNDDLPYWTRVNGKPHLVTPYSLVVNDARFVVAQGYGSPEHFYEYAKAELDGLRNDNDGVSRMMSIGLHARFSGHPSRADALARFIDYAQNTGDAVFMRRIDLARTFMDQYPAARALGETSG